MTSNQTATGPARPCGAAFILAELKTRDALAAASRAADIFRHKSQNIRTAFWS